MMSIREQIKNKDKTDKDEYKDIKKKLKDIEDKLDYLITLVEALP